MDEMHKELVARIAALEARMARLERRAKDAAAGGEDLRKAYPVMMNKTQAANVLGVTRATIYQMIADGRLKENGLGKIQTDSINRLIEQGKPPRKR